MEFVHIVRSEYNFNSLVKLDKAVKKAKKMGMKALAIADEHTMHYVVDFIELCKKEKLKPIIGMKINVDMGSFILPVTLFAKTIKGYKGMMRITSLIHYKKRRNFHLEKKEFFSYVNDTIVLVDLHELLEEEKVNVGVLGEGIIALREWLKEDLYLEVKDRGRETEKKINQKIKAFAQDARIFLMANNEVRYLEEKETKIASIHEAIRTEKNYKDVNISGQYMKTYEEMEKAYQYLPNALKNTCELANKTSVDFPLKGEEGFKRKAPEALIEPFESEQRILKSIEKFYTPIEGFIFPSDEKKRRSMAYLIYLAWKGFEKTYKKDPKAAERLKYELGNVLAKGYTDYFLVIHDLIDFCIKRDIPFSVRGSVLSSLLARTLDITAINPLEYDLQFERFLNPERLDEPDIDIDVSQKRRYEPIHYLRKKYGKNNVAQLVTIGKYGLSNAVKAVAKTLAISDKVAEKIIERLPENPEELREKTELIQMAKKDKKIKELIEAGYALSSVPRNSSRHAAGILLSGTSLINEIPLLTEADKGEQMWVTQIANNNGQLEKLGFLKIDLLGLRNLDVMADTIQMVKKRRGVDIREVPLDDEKTFQLYQKGMLTGGFQTDSEGMQEASRLIYPTDINDIIALVALYRPGPKTEIKRYAENKKNGNISIVNEKGEEIEGAKELEPILNETYGVLTYQEQIYKLAQVVGGYSVSEADLLRRAISKKKKEVLEEERKTFVQKAVQNKKSSKMANEIYDFIVRFANYGMNKAHSVGYALVSYKTMLYKSNFPEEFMTALINSLLVHKKKKTKQAAKYVEEAKKIGLTILKPNINDSYCDFVIGEKGIHFGLSMIKNVGRTYVEQIVEERKKGTFTSFENYVERMGSNAVLEILIKVGVFDDFGSRKRLLEKWENLYAKKSYMYSFSDIPGIKEDDPKGEGEFTLEERLNFEQEYACMYITETPLNALKEVVEEAEKTKPHHEIWIGGVVLEVKEHKTKAKQQEMAFVRAWTKKGECEFTIFPGEWKKYKENFSLFSPVLLKVKINKERKSVHVVTVEKIEDRKNIIIQLPLKIKNENMEEKKKWLAGLTKLFQNYPGKDDVTVIFGEKKLKRNRCFSYTKESRNEIEEYVKEKTLISVEKVQ